MAAAIRQAIVDDIFASREVFFLADAHVSQAGGLTETGALADDGSSVSVIAARKARTLAGECLDGFGQCLSTMFARVGFDCHW